MKFIHHNNSIGEIEFPKNLRNWISDYDTGLAPNFYIDLREEMPDGLGYITCLINREEGLALLVGFKSKYVDYEGNIGFVVRDIHNISDSAEQISFKTFEEMRNGWEFSKHLLIPMEKAISVIEYVIENLSYPDDVRLDKGADLND